MPSKMTPGFSFYDPYFMTYIFLLLSFLALLLLLLYFLGLYFAALYLAYAVILFCLFALIILIFHFYRVVILGNAPYIRSSKKLIRRIIEEIPFTENAKVYELGSGDGRFLRALAKKINIRAIGYENYILPYIISRIITFLTNSKVEIIHHDFFKADLSDADFIFCYLINNQMDKLEGKLQKELRPGALIISNTFKFKNWPLEKEIIINPKKKFALSNKIYLYRKV